MKKTRTNAQLTRLKMNTGQIDWLPKNPRQWDSDDLDRTVASIIEDPDFLEDRPLLAVENGKDLVVFGGNLRLSALRKTQYKTAPVVIYEPETDEDRETVKRRAMKDNGTFGSWDWDTLANEWDDEVDKLADWGVDIPPEWAEGASVGGEISNDGPGSVDVPPENNLQEKFIVPPFSVLDTRTAKWQERKAVWNSKIGDCGESRNDTLFKNEEMRYPSLYREFLTLRRQKKTTATNFREYIATLPQERMDAENERATSRGVSILDPVLAEICCKWFGIDGGSAFDPFAGDTCFGYVSAELGMRFTGIELRKDQAEINNDRVAGMDARYICDDGQNVAKHIEKESQDLLFSCPPYYNLEIYSDDPKDASNQETYEDFLQIIRNAFTSAVSCLKENRFAVIVVGDVRDNDSGEYYDFPGDIVKIFKSVGMHFMNECILLEATPSAALRAGKFMEGRKVVKCHQNVLVFYKGNPLMIADNFFPIDMGEEKKADILKLIESLETPDMKGLPEREYCEAIANVAREKCRAFVQTSGIADMKNAMTWAKGMILTQMFKPLVGYFVSAREKSGRTMKEIKEHLGNNMAGHYFTEKSQWLLPTEENYRKLQEIMPDLTRPYEEIRKEYDELQRLQDLQRLQNLQEERP